MTAYSEAIPFKAKESLLLKILNSLSSCLKAEPRVGRAAVTVRLARGRKLGDHLLIVLTVEKYFTPPHPIAAPESAASY